MTRDEQIAQALEAEGNRIYKGPQWQQAAGWMGAARFVRALPESEPAPDDAHERLDAAIRGIESNLPDVSEELAVTLRSILRLLKGER